MAVLAWLGIVGAVLAASVLLAAGILHVAGVPFQPEIHWAWRAAGLLVGLSGAALGAWTLRHHPARLMARSTARTIEIATRRLEPGGSLVPRLVTTGPYRYVRNPTYASIFLLFVGGGVAAPFTPLVGASPVLLLWWHGVVIPAEEKELRARFGKEYEEYCRRTGRMVPRVGRGGE